MDDLTGFVEKLAADKSLREEFAAAPRAVMRAQGFDPDLYAMPEKMELSELEARLSAFREQSGAGVAPPEVEEVPASRPGGEAAGANPHRALSRTATPGGLEDTGGAEAAGPPSGGLPLPEFERKGRGEAAKTRTKTAEAAEAKMDVAHPNAWFASHGTSVSRVLGTRKQETTRIIQEVILGFDDRVQVSPVRALPYRWVCSLVITAANGSIWQGTGWFASPRLVVTAGHCVYMHNQGGWVRRVSVYPGRDGMTAPFSFTSAEFITVDGWASRKLPEYDYGAVLIGDSSDEIGFFGYGALSSGQLKGLLSNVVGYPSDKPPGTLWGHSRNLGTVSPATLTYDIDTYGGMSGSPVIRWDGYDYIVVGIHNYGDLAGNRATRITPEVFQNIQLWAS